MINKQQYIRKKLFVVGKDVFYVTVIRIFCGERKVSSGSALKDAAVPHHTCFTARNKQKLSIY